MSGTKTSMQERIDEVATAVDEGKYCDHVSFGLCPDCIRKILHDVATAEVDAAVKAAVDAEQQRVLDLVGHHINQKFSHWLCCDHCAHVLRSFANDYKATTKPANATTDEEK